MDRPQPPTRPETPQELATSVAENTEAWLLYLRNTSQYMETLEEALQAERAHRQEVEAQLLGKEGVIQYQKEQLAADQKRITTLEVEKSHLAVAAAPAVQTPPTLPSAVPLPVAAAEAVADDTARPPAPPTPPRSGTASLSERIPDPKEFDGTRGDLRRFTQQIYGKLEANADRFPLAKQRMLYVAGRLTGKAYALMLPKIKYGIPQFIDYPQMLDYLEKAFGDPDRTQNAQNKLFQWKQKNMDFTVYLSEFQRLALEAEMPESALVPLLFQGVSRELQDMLLHSPAPSTEYHAYVSHLQTLDNRYRQHQLHVNRSRTAPPSKGAGSAPAPKGPPSQFPPAAANVSGEPMDLSNQRTTTTGGRRERNECFRCGSPNHRVRNCPHPDTRPVVQAHAGRLHPGSAAPSAPSEHRRDSPPRGRRMSPVYSPPGYSRSSPQSSPSRSVNGVSLS
jgi:hypothetical protein